MNPRSAFVVFCGALVLACNSDPKNEAMAPDPKYLNATQPDYKLRLPVPDASFRLTQEERASVQPRFDVDALERLLGMMQPSERAYVLASFKKGQSRELTYIGDPVLQSALGLVWKPWWDKMPRDVLLNDEAITHFAGVREARARAQSESGKGK